MGDYIIDSKTYNLSTRSGSCQLLNGEFKSNVQYNIADMIYKDNSIQYIQYSIPYVVIPVSFYQINETNNMLHLEINGDIITITFEVGNYNAFTFITVFKNVLLPSDGWDITLDNINSTFSITNRNSSFFIYGDSTIDYVIGFSDTMSSVVKNRINVITCQRPCNFLPLPRICIKCPQLSNEGNSRGNINSADIILSVPNNAKSGGQIVFKNIYSKTYLQTDRFKRLNIHN